MTENRALYRRLGYVETARVQEKGYDRVYMTKLLRTAAPDAAPMRDARFGPDAL